MKVYLANQQTDIGLQGDQSSTNGMDWETRATTSQGRIGIGVHLENSKLR